MIVGEDLPDVGECYGHVKRTNGVPEPDPFTTCGQCDGRHRHQWTECLVLTKGSKSLIAGTLIGHARRCLVCGGRQCDAECLERRHHAGPHMAPDGSLRPVGK